MVKGVYVKQLGEARIKKWRLGIAHFASRLVDGVQFNVVSHQDAPLYSLPDADTLCCPNSLLPQFTFQRHWVLLEWMTMPRVNTGLVKKNSEYCSLVSGY
jgi:hypothetical protein